MTYYLNQSYRKDGTTRPQVPEPKQMQQSCIDMVKCIKKYNFFRLQEQMYLFEDTL